MKKKLLLVILVGTMLTAAAAAGCGTFRQDAQTAENTESVENTQAAGSTETGTGTEEAGTVVRPLYPLEKAQDALADGGYSVSFTADDLVKTDAGYELTVEVYEYDRYEKEAIGRLVDGSRMQFCNKEITVDQVEKDSETGDIKINGGIENDGIELMEEDGLYRTVTLDDYPVYYSVGKVTIPLSEDVTLEEQTDPGQEPALSAAGLKDLPDAIENSDLPFTCNNTAITVRQEQIVQIIRYWVP